jgi:TIR domain
VSVRGPGRLTLLARLRNELERLHEAGDQVRQFASLDGKDWKDLELLDQANKAGLIDGDMRQKLAPFFAVLNRDPESRLEAPPGVAEADRTVYISYAWKDETPAGRDREAIVERLCDFLKGDNISIGRDKYRLRYKDSIDDFMREIGRGTCVVAFISDKYLRSDYCMFELFEVFRNGGAEDRLCVVLMPDARINDSAPYLEYWDSRFAEEDGKIKRFGSKIDRDGLLKKAQRCGDIARNVDRIMSFIADHVQLTAIDAEGGDFAVLREAIRRILG